MEKKINEGKIILSNTLKQLRTAAGFTQNQVAAFLHIDRSTYAKYEQGREPELSSLCALAKLYDISVDELVAESYVEVSSRTANVSSSKYSSMPDESFLPLSDEEKRLLTYFRKCAHPSNIINFAKSVYLDDVLNFEINEDF